MVGAESPAAFARDAGRAPLLALTGVSKSYGSIAALDAVSFDVLPGEIHGLCGHNGAGKSTLLKILAGVVEPDTGEVRMAGETLQLKSPRDAQAHGIALVDQELSIVSELSIEDNLLLGRLDQPLLRGRGAGQELRSSLELVGLGHVRMNALAGSLPIGERQLLEIARALGRRARLLILDEPTATLTDAESSRVFDAVRRVAADGRAAIFVSHRLDEVRALCDRVTVFRDGRNVATQAVSDTSGSELVTLILGEQLASSRAERDPARFDDLDALISVRGLAAGRRVAGISFEVRPGEIVALAGQVGAGPVDVLRALGGLADDVRGEVRLGSRRLQLGSVRRCAAAGVIYASHDRKGEGLFLGRSTNENLIATRLGQESHRGLLTGRRVRDVAGALAKAVGVRAERLSAPVSALSGGNQQKVLIGRGLRQAKNRVLLLDEPTRGVDIGGRADIHRLILEAAATGAAVVFSSTELDEVLDLADRVVTMRGGRMIATRSADGLTTADLLRDMTHGADDD